MIITTAIASAQWVPRINNKPFMPDDWLLSEGQDFHYRGGPSQLPRQMLERKPLDNELSKVRRISDIFDRIDSKAILLGINDQVVFSNYKSPANENRLLLSASIDKSLTAFSVGIAICEGRLKLSDKVSEIIPELSGIDIGKNSIKNLLTMTSGGMSADDSASSFSREEMNDILTGKKSYLDLMKTKWGSFKSGGVSGETFDYKSQDPILVAMVLSRVYGTSFREWQSSKFFEKVGVANYRVQGTDRFGNAGADSNTRLTLMDWARVAAYIQESRRKPDCYGKFLREASTKQISNTKRFISEFDGYGYFLWTDASRLPDAYAALGHGGQAIIWHKESGRYVVIFGNSISVGDALEIARIWFSVL